MIGRAAQGRPWLFREITHYLATGETLAPPARARDRARCWSNTCDGLYDLYGDEQGARVARKHIGWYAMPERRVPAGESAAHAR